MADAVVFRRRESVLMGEVEWRADDDGLTRREADGRETTMRWAEVRFVALRYNPTGLKPWLHMTRLVSAKELMVFDNGHYVGVGDFEDRSADYFALLRKALARIAVAAPDADIRVGSELSAYAIQIVMVLAALGALAFVLFTLPIPAPGPLEILVKLLVLLACYPLARRWLSTNRPRRLSAQEALADLPPAPDTIAPGVS